MLILLPGMTCDATLWAPQTSALSGGFSVSAIQDFYRHDSFTAMAREALDTAPPRFALAGHSMGARIALEIMRIAPERVERLALFDVTARPAGPDVPARRQKLEQLAREHGMAALVARWLPMILHPARLKDGVLVNSLMEMFCRATPDIYSRHVHALLTRPDYRPLLPNITCPTLIACGRHDLLCPVIQHQRMAVSIPGAKLAILENCAHMATLEAPDAVINLLRGWMGE